MKIKTHCEYCGSTNLSSIGTCMDIDCPGPDVMKIIESSHPRIVMVLSPYTDGDYGVVQRRVEQTQDYFMKLLELGMTPFSAIMQCHDVSNRKEIAGTFTQWGKYCLDMMSIADEIHVLMLDGWEESVGVRQEIEHAKSLNLQVSYVTG